MTFIQQSNKSKYAWGGTKYNCKNYLDHYPTWCGDCYACSKCGLIFTPKNSELRAFAEEIKKEIEGERWITNQYMELTKTQVAYNQALKDI